MSNDTVTRRGRLTANVDPATLEALREETGDTNLSVLLPNWEAIKRESIAVKLSVGRWRGTLTLSMADLGLDTVSPECTRAASRLVELGRRRLLRLEDERALKSKEVLGRAVLADYGFGCEFGELIPKRAYIEAVRPRLEQYRREYMAIGQRVTDEYLVWVPMVVETYRTLIATAWKVRRHLDPNTDCPTDLRELMDADVETELAKVKASIPPAEEIARQFRYEWIPRYVEGHSTIGDEEIDSAIREEIRQKAEQQYEEQVEEALSLVAIRVRTVLVQAAELVLQRQTPHARTLEAVKAAVGRVRLLNIGSNMEVEQLAETVETLAGACQGKERSWDDLRSVMDNVAIAMTADLGRLAAGGRLAGSDDLAEVIPIPAARVRRARAALGLEVGTDANDNGSWTRRGRLSGS